MTCCDVNFVHQLSINLQYIQLTVHNLCVYAWYLVLSHILNCDLFLSPAPLPSLQVSAGDNKVLTLPANIVSLYASAWPKETSGECWPIRNAFDYNNNVALPCPYAVQQSFHSKITLSVSLTINSVHNIYMYMYV